MNRLLIIGAGGMGRTLYDIAKESEGYGIEFEIGGFIDDNTESLAGFENYPPVLGTISDYIPQLQDVFTCSIGGTTRKKCIETILERGGKFINIVHKTARICTNVKIGIGNIVGAFTTLGSDSCIGDFNMIQSYSVIGHDVRIGNFNRIDTHVTCVGGIRIDNQTMIHTGAVLNHNIRVEDRAKVGACSFVIRNVKEDTTVFGNPAKKLI